MKKFAALILPFIAGAAFTAAVPASIIQLGINGDAQMGSNYFDFGQYPNGAPYTPAPGYGTYEISLINSGDFSSAGVTTGEFGSIQSLNEPPGAVTLPSAFMTFDTGGSNLQLWATNIPPGTVGPFFLTDTDDGTVASFNVDGYVLDTNTDTEIDTFTGTFSATFDGQPVASLFTMLPINTPFSATFTATPIPMMPEPSGAILLLASALAICLRRPRCPTA
jgi:hypothetical protein